MTTISAAIIADSIGADAPRLTTLHLRYPRFIHAELMTHRVFSRNARSSRAVPVARMIAEVEDDPVIPLHWGAAQPGMQADRELAGPARIAAECHWRDAARDAVTRAKKLATCGAHKQVVNRVLEPYLHIDVLVTATEWANFLALRDHPAAEPHMRLLAQAVRAALAGSAPTRLGPSAWHLPYVTDAERASSDEMSLDDLRMSSAARCARISYRAHDDGFVDTAADLALAQRLAASGHWSPFEHQATPEAVVASAPSSQVSSSTRYPRANLVGWVQYRKLFPNESGARS